MELLQLPAEITKVTTMSHRSLRVVADTQENLTDEQMAKVMAYHGKLGWFCFLPEERKIDTLDVLNTPPMEWDKDNGKTPGQRLRGVLYVMWEQKKSTDTFAQFYEQSMERIINQLKEKLT